MITKVKTNLPNIEVDCNTSWYETVSKRHISGRLVGYKHWGRSAMPHKLVNPCHCVRAFAAMQPK